MSKRVVVFGWALSVHTCRWVRGMAARGFDIRLISLGGEPLEDVPTTVFPRKRKISYVGCAWQAAQAARRQRPDLVHVHYVTGFGLWGLVARLRPMLVSVWGSDILDTEAGAVKRVLIRRVLRKATWITATSKNLEQETLRIAPKSAGKISIVPFGVNVTSEVAPEPPGHPVMLCLTKIHRPVSGCDVLLRAMQRVRDEVPDCRLSIAGSGEFTGELRRLTSQLGLDKNVTFVGQLTASEMPRFIEKHHIMVMPSRRESFGVAALEAGACGRPVIASNVGGIPEVVREGETGMLVPPEDPSALADGIIRLARHPEERRQLGRAAHAFVGQNYRWEKSLDLMSELYDRLIHG